MGNTLFSRMQSVQFGEVQHYKSIAILPLIAADGAFQYRTLGEALATSDLTITEVSAAGSVPELLVINRGNSPVLLIDGEELVGAKQNRVLNTSILLKERSETRIPVSCTEQGRWSYSSASFAESENVMAHKVRALKSFSVSNSLESFESFHSNQGEVWHGIAELQAKACYHSPTSAMNDVFKTRDQDLRECGKIFRCVPGQVGLLAFVDGVPAGLDLVSLHSAYARIHPKLLRSYLIESLIESRSADAPVRNYVGKARTLMERIAKAQERRFPSVGCGFDCRYRGDSLAGAALVHENELIHAAFFRLEEAERPDFRTLASWRKCRRTFNR